MSPALLKVPCEANRTSQNTLSWARLLDWRCHKRGSRQTCSLTFQRKQKACGNSSPHNQSLISFSPLDCLAQSLHGRWSAHWEFISTSLFSSETQAPSTPVNKTEAFENLHCYSGWGFDFLLKHFILQDSFANQQMNACLSSFCSLQLRSFETPHRREVVQGLPKRV